MSSTYRAAPDVAQIGGLDPEIVLSGHLPPAPGAMLERMLAGIATGAAD